MDTAKWTTLNRVKRSQDNSNRKRFDSPDSPGRWVSYGGSPPNSQAGQKSIISAGIILFTEEDGKRLYLLGQKRYTYHYFIFVRGKWESLNEIPSLLRNMTKQEHNNLKEQTFSTLWSDMWLHHQFPGYKNAHLKFQEIKRDLPQLCEEFPPELIEAPWIFPKGRKELNESLFQCACREFKEETTIDMSQLNFIKTKVYKLESTKDELSHETSYYLAFSNVKIDVIKKRIDKCLTNEIVTDELSDVKWFTLEECGVKLTPEKFELLREIDADIEKL